MEIIVSVEAENLLARLAQMPNELRGSLMVVMRRLAIAVQRSVKEDKLTGQVLNVRTGNLRRSINQEVTETAEGIFAIVGTNVKYAAVHEYGFSGIVNVKAHVRHLRKHSRTTAKGRVIRGKLTGEMAYVSPHSRRMELPERSFLRSTLRDFAPRIKSEIHEAAMKAFNEK